MELVEESEKSDEITTPTDPNVRMVTEQSGFPMSVEHNQAITLVLVVVLLRFETMAQQSNW